MESAAPSRTEASSQSNHATPRDGDPGRVIGAGTAAPATAPVPRPPRPTPRVPGTPVFECEPIDVGFFRDAPARFTFERILDAPADRVFEIFEDPYSWPVWGGPGIQEVEWTTPKPFGVDTERTVFFMGGMEVYERFFIWEPGKEMAFHFTGATARVWWAFGEHYELTDLGRSCRWRWTVAYDPRHVLARIHPLAKPGMKLALGKIADGLVDYVKTHR